MMAGFSFLLFIRSISGAENRITTMGNPNQPFSVSNRNYLEYYSFKLKSMLW